MAIGSLAAALEQEHREIDDEIEAFTARSPSPGRNPQGMGRAIQVLRRHIYAEEQFLFPPLFHAGLKAPVLVMLREHAQIWKTLDSLEVALASAAALHLAPVLGHQLAVQLTHHNLKEEKVLYPQADVALGPAAAAQLRAFLNTGDLPPGWVCLRASG
jgi:iron-sulfur cluster repair protein YtfE (RIC family)